MLCFRADSIRLQNFPWVLGKLIEKDLNYTFVRILYLLKNKSNKVI